ncbi:hydroxymethylglutaryl-CoA synthase family protein [Azospirillum sp. B4]|uniref:hydroxymethylglutaryl-CoA synthase family protein n=1 Tax=Azospirillum sp. B4 TaxID=95605 RepID=UPI000345CF90|nr:hydroxymethylglutaryl-CoA synthase [Azospirillum sp. B4]
MSIGIERMGVYAGRAYLDVGELARARGLDQRRFENLLMRRRSLVLPFEDPVSFAVNAAKPLIDGLSAAERAEIRLLIVASESGIDQGKSMGAYVHKYLQLDPRCRQFELKQACYGGTAALRMAAAWAASDGQGARALVVCTDLGRPVRHSYAEPSQGSAAVALLIGGRPDVLALEPGASGIHSYEVADSCRPTADMETGDADMSLLSYLTCCEQAFAAYRQSVGPIDFVQHFERLAFHTPFGGMVKGAHRTLMRKLMSAAPDVIEADFQRRAAPSLTYCREVGNIYSGTVFLALAGAIDDGDDRRARRIGLFSYGSGCCSEFYSGIAPAGAARALAEAGVADALAGRVRIPVARYDALLDGYQSLSGVRDVVIDAGDTADLYEQAFAGRGYLVLDRVAGWQRQYRWS